MREALDNWKHEQFVTLQEQVSLLHSRFNFVVMQRFSPQTLRDDSKNGCLAV